MRATLLGMDPVKRRLPILPLVLCLLLTGCKFDVTKARDSLAVSRGIIMAAQAQYSNQCKANPSLSPCLSINRAIAAHSAAIDAINLYCSGPGWAEGAPCNPRAGFESKAEEAIRELNRIIPHIRALISRRMAEDIEERLDV